MMLFLYLFVPVTHNLHAQLEWSDAISAQVQLASMATLFFTGSCSPDHHLDICGLSRLAQQIHGSPYSYSDAVERFQNLFGLQCRKITFQTQTYCKLGREHPGPPRFRIVLKHLLHHCRTRDKCQRGSVLHLIHSYINVADTHSPSRCTLVIRRSAFLQDKQRVDHAGHGGATLECGSKNFSG